jgi:GNAT superfamily N-acetyltransferase
MIPEDREELLEVLKATGVFQSYEIEVADEVLRESLKPASGYSCVCAVNDADRPFGYVCWGATPCTSGTYDLYWIAVHPGSQGTGAGKALLQVAEEGALKEGARLMIIETSAVSDYEGTRQFYLRNGYSELAVIQDFYRSGDHKIIYGKYFVS